MDESEIRDLGDSVVWLGHVHARGRTSHVELDHDFGVHILLRDDEGIRAEAFLTWQEALEPPGCRSSALDEKQRFVWKAALR